MTPEARWERIYQSFDPDRPAVDPAERADRPYSPAERVAAKVRRRDGPFHLFFTGTVGSGKTTELHEICRRVANRRRYIFIDLESHLRESVGDPAAVDRLQPWEVVFLVGVAVYRDGLSLGIEWTAAEKAAVEAAWTALARPDTEGGKVNLADLGAGLAILVGGGAALASDLPAPGVGTALALVTTAATRLAASVRWELPFGRRNALARDDQELPVRAMLAATNRLIHRFQAERGPLLLVVDGLDRVTDPAQNVALFERSRLLTELDCGLVLTASLAVVRQRAQGFEPEELANVPVVDRALAPKPSPWCAFFVEMWKNRVPEADRALLSEAQLLRLGWASGGLARHFCRLVRELADACIDARLEGATDPVVEAAIDRVRRTLQWGVTREEIVLLESVAADVPAHRLPGGELAAALLHRHQLLPYPNDDLWYYPHPLMTLSLVRTPS